MNVLLRADASNSIGAGHVTRDLVLAKKLGSHNVIFATRPLNGNLDAVILESGFRVHSLASNALVELTPLIREYAIDLLIIDHYELDYAFEKAIKKQHPLLTLMVLDDTYEKHYCDILLNHNVYAKKRRYKNLVPKKCLVQCGAKHTLLRDEFLASTKVPRRDALLIAMGGADTKNLSLKILKLLPESFSWHIDVVTTRANKNLKKLQKEIEERDNVTLHIQTKELANLAKSARLAIITPSVIANELYYLQTPFIAIQSAENQKVMRKFLQKKGYNVLKKFSSKKLKTLLRAYL